MKLLFITPHYFPDGGPSAPLYSMLCEELARRGHDVNVICAVPHYPSGKTPQNYKSFKIYKEFNKGVNIIRVPLPSIDRKNLKLRFLQFICFQLGAVLAGLRTKYDVVISSNPALQIGLPFLFFGKFRNKPSIFSVHDFYPDVGIKLGIFKSNFIVFIVDILERMCFKSATKIRVLSESFIPKVNCKGIERSKICLIYDWVDPNFIKPIQKENKFSKSFNLINKFVILYAGNIGFSQGLEYLLEAAEYLSDEKDVMFVFVGEGPNKSNLIKLANEKGLKNVIFIDFQPRETLPEVLAAADISIVTLKKNISFESLPSKTYSMLASGRPIIACLDEGSDSYNLILRSGGGICIPPEEPDKLVKAIIKLKENKELRELMGMRGRDYIEKFHSPEYAADKYEELFRLIKKGQ